MRLVFYLGHPAHFHLFKNSIKALHQNGHNVTVAIKTKDILADLLDISELSYVNLMPYVRSDNRLSILFGLAYRDVKLFSLCIKMKPDMLIGSAAEIAHVGKLLRIPSLVLFEDDLEAVPQFAKLAAPFATDLICPQSCNPGKWIKKSIQYNSYHELAYLAPEYFTPDFGNISHLLEGSKYYFLLRFAKLTAYHDEGKRGITKDIALKIIDILKPHGRIYISSERELEPEFEQYRIQINPLIMHDVLSFARLYIGDSQTMAAEAAVLGTPSIRFNDFVGKLGYLEELEHVYHLTYGIKTAEEERLYHRIIELLSIDDLRNQWNRKRATMLNEKIDLTKFLSWYVENYPESKRQYRADNAIQYRFKLKEINYAGT